MDRIGIQKFGLPTIITVENIRNKFPGLPDEYYFYLQRTANEPPLEHTDTDSSDHYEYSGCDSVELDQSCAFPVQLIDFGSPRSHTPGGNIQLCDADDGQGDHSTKQYSCD